MITSRQSCLKIQTEALTHLSGETSSLEKQRFESHLEGCEDCRERVAEISKMMETARAQPFLPSPTVRDRMFAKILEGTGSTEVPTGPRQGGVLNRFPENRLLSAVLIAATILALATVAIFTLKIQGVPQEGMPTSDGRPSSVAASLPSPPAAAFLATTRPTRSLTVGVTPETRYSLEIDRGKGRLQVKRGRLWIRFEGTPEMTCLEVTAPELTAEVVGTVLVVDVDEQALTSVGVFEGKVRVTSDGGDETLLSEGEVRQPTGRVVPMRSEMKAQVTRWLSDLPEPRQRALQPAATDEPALLGPSSEPDIVVKQDRAQAGEKAPQDLYLEAERQMEKGAFQEAARSLERLIDSRPDSGRADTARLELARIYTRHLHRADRAVFHLEAYLARHPSGGESKLVKKRLCGLSKKQGARTTVRCEGN